MKKIFSSIMTLAVALAFTACGGNSNDGSRKAQELSGAGATFPLPFYNVVFENFAQVNGDAVAYGGIGSGGVYVTCATKLLILQVVTLFCPTRRWLK